MRRGTFPYPVSRAPQRSLRRSACELNISKGTFDATHFQLLNGTAMQLGPNIVSTEIAQLSTVKTHRNTSPRKAGARRQRVEGRARSSGERTDASHRPFTRSKGSHGPIGGLRQMLVVGRPFRPDTSAQAPHGPSDPRTPSRAASFLSPLPHATRAGENTAQAALPSQEKHSRKARMALQYVREEFRS